VPRARNAGGWRWWDVLYLIAPVLLAWRLIAGEQLWQTVGSHLP
jgi:hypothetical protein